MTTRHRRAGVAIVGAGLVGAGPDGCRVACGRGRSPDKRGEMFESAKQAACDIIDTKGSTYCGIGLGAVQIVEAIFQDQGSIPTVSTLVENRCGSSDVHVSLPCMVIRVGAARFLDLPLQADEVATLQGSASVLTVALRSVGLRNR